MAHTHAALNAGTSSTLAPLFVDARSRRIISQLERVSPSEASILIVGETGTAKEVIAQQMHRRSGRSGPFVAVNCGALSETLGKVALFGREAGAYTGANGARPGWFEAAHGGTLFLDEIGDLPLTLQVALLRVLQERQVVRLGSRKSLPIDVRVIAATNIDVGQAVRHGKFRLDLYFRLSVVTLELPALRERAADILPLAEHFIRVYGEKLQRPLPTLDREAKHALVAYSWPGNVRELENVIHGAVLVANETIQRADLRLVPLMSATEMQGNVPAHADHDLAPRVQPSPLDALTTQFDQLFAQKPEQLMANLESLLVSRALDFCHGNQVHTAKLLGISRNVLRTYLKRFGLLSSAGVDRQRSRASAVAPTVPPSPRPASGVIRCTTAMLFEVNSHELIALHCCDGFPAEPAASSGIPHGWEYSFSRSLHLFLHHCYWPVLKMLSPRLRSSSKASKTSSKPPLETI